MNTSIRTRSIVGGALCACFWLAILSPTPAAAALDAYAVIIGENQGIISGDVTVDPHVGKILIKAFGNSISADYDAETGIPSDGKQHRPVRLLKDMDSASTKLLTALKDNETLTTVTIEFFRPTQAGAEELYVTVVLENAHVVSIIPGHSSQADDLQVPFRETIGLTYESMTVTWESSGGSTQIHW